MLKSKRILMMLAVLWIAAAVCALATVRQFRPELGVPEESTAESAYLLRAKSGYVAVYRADAPDTPVQITDIAVSDLRRQDQQMLRTGLGVKDRETLLMLLEDLKS